MDFLLGVLAKFFGHSLGLPPQYKFVKRLGKVGVGAAAAVGCCKLRYYVLLHGIASADSTTLSHRVSYQ
jgi:hypothetical protein